MEVLTKEQAGAWLSSAGTGWVPGEYKLPSLLRPSLSNAIIAIPQDVRSLVYFAGALGGWLHPTAERLLWLDSEGRAPWDHATVLRRLRDPAATRKTYADAPATVFAAGELFNEDQAESGPDAEENTVLTAMLFHVMCMDGRGLVVAHGSNEFILLDDETIVLGNLPPERRAAAKMVAGPTIQVRWAYSIDDFRPYVFNAGRVED